LKRLFLSLALLAGLASPALAVVENTPTFASVYKAIASGKVANTTGSGTAQTNLKFGQAFARGDVPRNKTVALVINGAAVATQIDAKTRYDDGSIKFAVITAQIPAVSANSTIDYTIALADPPANAPTAVNLTGSGYGLTAALTIGGSNVTLDFGAAIAAGNYTVWRQGALATEGRVDLDAGSAAPGLHVVADITANSDGSEQATLSFNNDYALTSGLANVTYSATINQNGSAAKTVSGITQYPFSWWRWDVATDAAHAHADTPILMVKYDPAYLAKSGAILNYDLSGGIDNAQLISVGTGWDAPFVAGSGGLLNGITQGMSNSGTRPDIGPLNAWETGCIRSQATDACRVALIWAWSSAQIPWHYRDKANATWVNIDKHPSWYARNTDATGATGPVTAPDATSNGWTTDQNHTPSLNYWAYLSTGERWYLDGLQAQASFQIDSTNTAERSASFAGGLGTTPQSPATPYLLGACDNGVQLRGFAWALRDVQLAAWASPDGTAEKAFYTNVAVVNHRYRTAAANQYAQQFLNQLYGYGCIQPPGNNIQAEQASYLGNVVGWGAVMPEPWASSARAHAALLAQWEAQKWLPQSGGYTAAYGQYQTYPSPDGGTNPLKTWAAIKTSVDGSAPPTSALVHMESLSAVNALGNALGKGEASATSAAANIGSVTTDTGFSSYISSAVNWPYRVAPQ
jgi:hypothetical protein